MKHKKYIFKVLRSCKTKDQVETWENWAYKFSYLCSDLGSISYSYDIIFERNLQLEYIKRLEKINAK